VAPIDFSYNFPGASTPYKRWSECSIEKVRGEVFAAFFRKLRGEAKISLLVV